MPREGGGGKPLRIALAALAALVVAAGSAVAYFLLDTNRLKAPLEKWVSARTGRDLRIGGDLRVQLGRYSSLSIGGVELANADWASEPVMVKADRVSLSVDLASVLEGPLVIEELGIAGARIRLEKGAGEPQTGSSPRAKPRRRPASAMGCRSRCGGCESMIASSPIGRRSEAIPCGSRSPRSRR
jgi:uncharacterized protein involved in outer membrane biogenesis